MSRSEIAKLSSQGFVVGNSKTVLLEPKDWVGSRLPLLDHIDIGSRLARGDWMLLLYHHDCPKCQELLSTYQGPAQRFDEHRVAIVEVPPYSAVPQIRSGALEYGRLADVNVWFVEAPVQVVLKDSIVLSVTGPRPD